MRGSIHVPEHLFFSRCVRSIGSNRRREDLLSRLIGRQRVTDIMLVVHVTVLFANRHIARATITASVAALAQMILAGVLRAVNAYRLR